MLNKNISMTRLGVKCERSRVVTATSRSSNGFKFFGIFLKNILGNQPRDETYM